MKMMKKVLALVMAMAMVLGMAVTTFAATTPTENDKKTATVSNVESGATVTAYQIVKANYDTNGFTGYAAAEGVTLADVTKPTSDEVTAIAKNIKDGTLTLTSVPMTQGAADSGYASYTAELNAGYWLVLVEGSDLVEVYNLSLIHI